MKAIMVMFDSLNRHMLSPYGCDWVKTPNFDRLAERSVMFTQSYVGSMPCMPARKDLHTGRYSFLHRSWGPLEPFDNSMPELLKHNGVHTHLASDHYHYWEDGGSNYHTRYSTWEFARGQEGDPWKGQVAEPERPEACIGTGVLNLSVVRQDWINRKHMPDYETHCQKVTFDMGLDFIRSNAEADRWFVQIETFDPHEPFFSHQKYKDLYPHAYDGPHFDWPSYLPVHETREQIDHVRNEYAALVSMCDDQLGRVLDAMDEHDLWDDTMLIVCTDHGFLLGEHGWWGKVRQPFYNEVALTPLFIWDPRSGRHGVHSECLVQMIDLPATLLELFGVPLPAEMLGKPLRETLVSDAPVREACLFGMHSLHVNCTDGRYVYMRSPVEEANANLYEYTLMPSHMKNRFTVQELQQLELAEPFSFTKGCRTLKIKATSWILNQEDELNLLFDLHKDPGQLQPIHDPEAEQMMIRHMLRLMQDNDAPPEQYVRLNLKQK